MVDSSAAQVTHVVGKPKYTTLTFEEMKRERQRLLAKLDELEQLKMQAPDMRERVTELSWLLGEL